jgi:hypothetical protein
MFRKDWHVLAPDHRSVLLDLLRPPPEFSLDVAVVTTFTLDLEAALVAPLAFAAFDTEGPGDPIATLEAVRSASDRFTVFCQAGEMRLPQAASDLFAFVEPVVHEVRRPRAGHLFHPKLWLLRYRGPDDETSIRVLVPTRNLTNDASWDAVLRLDGTPVGGPAAANKPLADLVRWCCSNTPRGIEPSRLAGIESLVESVRRTEWEYPEGVNEMVFHTLGVAGRQRPDFTGNRHLVISPFVNADGLDFVAPSADPVVISRPEQLELLPTDVVAGLDCRWFATPTIGDAEERPSPKLGDLHAKVIVAERGRRAHVYVGSANATGAAFGGNVEIVVELRGGKAALGIDATLADLAKVTESCQIEGGREPSEADELQRIVDDLLRDAALSDIELNVTAAAEGAWCLAIASAVPLVPDSAGARVTAELLSRPGYALDVPAGLPLSGVFDDVSTPDVTPFVIVRVEVDGATQTATGATVVRATINGDPPGRLDSVIARQVDTPAKFLRFLFLLLGMAGGGIPSWLQPNGDGTNDGSNDRVVDLIELGVFEALTRALVSSPAALADLGRLVDRLRTTEAGKRTLPEGFDELWEAVSDARALIGATGQ